MNGGDGSFLFNFRELAVHTMLRSEGTQSREGRNTWRSSPLVHFLLIALLLAGAHAFYLKFGKKVVQVSREWVEVLEKDFSMQIGRAPTEDERKVLVVQQVRNEILCQEALAEGHLEDPRVRRLLASIMREKLEPVVGEPNDDELKRFREIEPASWRAPEQVSFDHVSFVGGLQEAGTEVLARLRAGEVIKDERKVALPNPMPMTWMPQIEKMMGKEFSDALKKMPEGEWQGPVESSLGVHFVRVVRRAPEHDMPFESVRSALETKWIEEKKDEAVRAAVDAARSRYRVSVPQGYRDR